MRRGCIRYAGAGGGAMHDRSRRSRACVQACVNPFKLRSRASRSSRALAVVTRSRVPRTAVQLSPRYATFNDRRGRTIRN